MTSKDLLEHYAAVRAETAQLEHEIADLCGKGWRMATDCVLASPPHEPYQQRPMPISGYVQTPEVARERKRLVKLYDKQLRELYFWQARAEEFLQTVPNPIDRVILRGYYIDGKQWKDVAAELAENTGRDYSEAAVKMRAKRFFEKAC